MKLTSIIIESEGRDPNWVCPSPDNEFYKKREKDLCWSFDFIEDSDICRFINTAESINTNMVTYSDGSNSLEIEFEFQLEKEEDFKLLEEFADILRDNLTIQVLIGEVGASGYDENNYILLIRADQYHKIKKLHTITF